MGHPIDTWQRRDPVVIETIAAEHPKFTAPMLLIHGLWCTAAAWHRFMGYLAHLGWTCHAVNLRGRAETQVPVSIGRVRFADYLDEVRGAVAACGGPPVVVGHDLGGLLALHCAAAARAVVALAPILPLPLATEGTHTFLGMRSRLALWCSQPLPAPRGQRGSDYFAQGAPGGTRLDSGTVARELTQHDLGFSVDGRVPLLVVAGAADTICRPYDVERLATYAGATYRCLEGVGHALPWQAGWENCVKQIHRWLVQQLGESLLVLNEEEEP
ncbi:MAG: alpha/beta fold hydrolase [Candidatus Binatia bacterium]